MKHVFLAATSPLLRVPIQNNSTSMRLELETQKK